MSEAYGKMLKDVRDNLTVVQVRKCATWLKDKKKLTINQYDSIKNAEDFTDILDSTRLISAEKPRLLYDVLVEHTVNTAAEHVKAYMENVLHQIVETPSEEGAQGSPVAESKGEPQISQTAAPNTDPKKIIPDKKLMKLAGKLPAVSNWKDLMLNGLDLSDAEIKIAKSDSDDMVDSLYKMLRTWKRKNQLHATAEKLMKILQDNDVDVDIWRILL